MMTDQGVVRAEGFGVAEMITALEDTGKRFVDLLRSLDPQDADRAVPNMKWTVAETAVHMLTIIRRGLGDRRRADSIEGLAELNDQTITEVVERSTGALASMIEADMETYMGLLRGAPQELMSRAVRLHAGVQADVPTALSYQLFDFLAHGMDIARATGRPWTIRDEFAALTLRACLPAFRPWVTDEVFEGPVRQASFALRGSPFCLVVQVGGVSYDVGSLRRESVEADVDPVEMFLAVAGRVDAEDPFIGQFAGWFRPI